VDPPHSVTPTRLETRPSRPRRPQDRRRYQRATLRRLGALLESAIQGAADELDERRRAASAGELVAIYAAWYEAHENAITDLETSLRVRNRLLVVAMLLLGVACTTTVMVAFWSPRAVAILLGVCAVVPVLCLLYKGLDWLVRLDQPLE
jgi:hypothetical protein